MCLRVCREPAFFGKGIGQPEQLHPGCWSDLQEQQPCPVARGVVGWVLKRGRKVGLCELKSIKGIGTGR